MRDEIQEKYVFYRMAYADFEECIQTLDLLSTIEDRKVKLAVSKSAIIAYYRPFSGSNPVHRQRTWKLDTSLVLDLNTHNKAEEYRMHLIAHTDLEHRKPNLGKLGDLYPISFKGFYYEDYMQLSKSLRSLAESMCMVLSAEISKYEKENF